MQVTSPGAGGSDMSDTGLVDPPVAGGGDRSSRSMPLGVMAVAGVMVLALVFGWPTRHGAFLSGDDQRFITDHVLVNHPSCSHAWTLLTIRHGDLYQPLPMLSFQANYAAATAEPGARFGVSPYGFHLTNIALHMLNAALACLLASAITRRRLAGFLTGAMFACHPFALESVAWISGRMMLLATTFALVTLLLCVRRRSDARGRWPWLAGIAWVFSLASKVIPTVPIAAAWCDRARHGSIPRRAGLTYAVLLALAVGATFAALATSRGAGFAPGAGTDSDAGLALRGLLACGYYVENYVAPVRLASWSPPPLNVSLSSGAAWVSVVECIAFVVMLLLARRFSRTAFIGLVLFAILLAPFLAASAGRRLLAADRYMYLPIFGLHLALAGITVQVADALRRRNATRPLLRRLAFVPIAALLCYWLAVGRGLAPSWADTVRRAERVVDVYPQSILAQAELAKAHLFERKPDAALRVIAAARQRLGDHPRLAAQAGEAYRQKRDWPRAQGELRSAAEAMPDHVRTQYYYALTLQQVGEHAEAQRLLRHLCATRKAFHPAAAALARSYTASGDIDKAIAAWQTALERKPFDRDSAYELSLLLLARGEAAEAETRLRGILALNPDDRAARFHLAVALADQTRAAEALDQYDRLIAKNADSPTVRLNRAAVLIALGRDGEAEGEYRAVLEHTPNQFDAAAGLHTLLFRANRLADILSLWTEFPDNEARSLACMAWAHALNSRIDGEAARALIAAIPADSPSSAAANWAVVYDALRRSADDDLQACLGEPRSGDLQGVEPQIRGLIASALAALPAPIRHSTAGRYTLARWLHDTGDKSNARLTARQLIDTAQSDRWTQAATRLLTAIDESGDPPPSSGP